MTTTKWISAAIIAVVVVGALVNMVDSTEVINSIKDWFSSLTAGEISKAASVVKKTETTAAKTGK